MSGLPSTLYYASTILSAICIPGHILFGRENVEPALAKLPSTSEILPGKTGARVAWNNFNCMLAVSALLNYQWARTGGPKTFEEKSIVWVMAVVLSYGGYGYFKSKVYPPLVCLWLAPFLSAGALLVQDA